MAQQPIGPRVILPPKEPRGSAGPARWRIWQRLLDEGRYMQPPCPEQHPVVQDEHEQDLVPSLQTRVP